MVTVKGLLCDLLAARDGGHWLRIEGLRRLPGRKAPPICFTEIYTHPAFRAVRDLGGRSTDIEDRLQRFRADNGPRAKAMWVSTFHSMCVRILRAEAKTIGLKSSFSIYDADDSKRLMTMVGRDLDLDPKRYPARSLSAQVSNLKNELVTAQAWADRASNAYSMSFIVATYSTSCVPCPGTATPCT